MNSGHIKNRDILIGSIAAVMAGAISYLASMAQWAMLFGGMRGDDEEGGSKPPGDDSDHDRGSHRCHPDSNGHITKP